MTIANVDIDDLVFTLHGYLDINDLKSEQIDIRDIARGLATEYRYSGQTISPYSVAEHSVLVSLFVPPELAKQALLHDAAEAYLKDLPRIIKYRGEMAGYLELESVIQKVIFERFGVVPTPESTATISVADKRVALSEIARFFSHKPGFSLDRWRQRYGEPIELDSIPCLAWQDAELLFCARYSELFHTELPE